MAERELIAACAFGLEAVVRNELTRLGYESKGGPPGQVLFQGDFSAICKTNLWLRSADRVRICLARFPAPDFDTLFETIQAMDWAQWIPRHGAFPVAGRSLKSQLTSVPAIQRTVKKAIVNALLKQHGTRDLPETGETYPLEIAILKDEATLTLDTTGPSLHKRGYREENGPAPLKETLAAALVQLSFWSADLPLLDPLCGTGTIPIEAALLGRNLAPGRNRTFVAETWGCFPSKLWDQERAAARDQEIARLPVRLVGTDSDGHALSLARDNARRADVEQDIHFQERDFRNLSSQQKYGCLITNPPYGQRIGDEDEVRLLHQMMPEVLSRLPTWSHFILTPFPLFERTVQKQANRRRKLYNGRIECTYYQFHGPKAPGGKQGMTADEDRLLRHEEWDSVSQGESENSALALGHHVPGTVQPPAIADTGEDEREEFRGSSTTPAVFGGLSEKATDQAELFKARLQNRARHLRRWPSRRKITCFRLYDRDVPEIPLIVDRYEDHLHLIEYERPHDRDLAQHAQWLDLMARTASTTLGIPFDHVFLKRRQRQRGAEQHQKYAERAYEIIAHEGGLKFYVNLSDYADTGLFLDHRVTRSMVRDQSNGKRFLNLFGYTGAFSVYAADGGAMTTTTVDLSPVYMQWAERNMKLNGLAGSKHQFIRSDALTYLRGLPETLLFDLAVVDPPTFSNSKRTEDVWDVQQNYADCLNLLLSRMSPAGLVYFSTNFRRFQFDETRILASSIREISRQTVPEDYRNQRIHRCWQIIR